MPESCYHFLSRESRAEFGRGRCLKREECCFSSVPNREEVVSPGAPGSCLAGQTVREEAGLSGEVGGWLEQETSLCVSSVALQTGILNVNTKEG